MMQNNKAVEDDAASPALAAEAFLSSLRGDAGCTRALRQEEIQKEKGLLPSVTSQV